MVARDNRRQAGLTTIRDRATTIRDRATTVPGRITMVHGRIITIIITAMRGRIITAMGGGPGS